MALIKEGIGSAKYITNFAISWDILQEFVKASQPSNKMTPTMLSTNNQHYWRLVTATFPYLQLYTMKESSAEPAPTITAQILSSRETHHIEVLPDWGAHILAAGKGMSKILGQHIDNLLPSNINPWAVNDTS